MISQKTIFVSAQLLINQHGSKAEEYASQRMLALVEQGNAKEAGVWLSIASAIEDLMNVMQKEKLH